MTKTTLRRPCGPGELDLVRESRRPADWRGEVFAPSRDLRTGSPAEARP